MIDDKFDEMLERLDALRRAILRVFYAGLTGAALFIIWRFA